MASHRAGAATSGRRHVNISIAPPGMACPTLACSKPRDQASEVCLCHVVPYTMQHPRRPVLTSLRRFSEQVSVILSAAAEGPVELDDCIQTLGKADLLDSDLTEYVASLVAAEVSPAVSKAFFC